MFFVEYALICALWWGHVHILTVFQLVLYIINNKLRKITTNVVSSERFGVVRIGDCLIGNVYTCLVLGPMTDS